MGSDFLFEIGGLVGIGVVELVEDGGDDCDGFHAFFIGPLLPAGAGFGGVVF